MFNKSHNDDDNDNEKKKQDWWKNENTWIVRRKQDKIGKQKEQKHNNKKITKKTDVDVEKSDNETWKALAKQKTSSIKIDIKQPWTGIIVKNGAPVLVR